MYVPVDTNFGFTKYANCECMQMQTQTQESLLQPKSILIETAATDQSWVSLMTKTVQQLLLHHIIFR